MAEQKVEGKPQVPPPPPPPRQPDDSLKGYIERGNESRPASRDRSDAPR